LFETIYVYIQLAQATQDEAEDEAEDDRTDLDSSADDQSHTRPISGLTISSTTDRGSSMQSPDLKRSSATIATTTETKSGNSMAAPTTGKRRRVVMQSSLLLKFLNPDFPMFHNRETLWVKSEFGVLNDDLFFNDSTVAELASKNQ